MDIIKKSINEGIEKLNETIKTYEELYQKAVDYKDGLEISLNLMNESVEGIKYNNSVKRVESLKSRIDYVNFIINEVNNIRFFVNSEEKVDFNNHCIYFGTNILYYSDKFLQLSSNEMFDTILNHIFYYTGCLYIVINNDVKLSYITSAFGICYGKNIDFKLGQKIYTNYYKTLDNKILNTNSNYRDFIINNSSIMPFFKDMSHRFSGSLTENNTIYLTYRILLGNIITLQNMGIKISNPKDRVSVCNMYSINFGEEDFFFSIA